MPDEYFESDDPGYFGDDEPVEFGEPESETGEEAEFNEQLGEIMSHYEAEQEEFNEAEQEFITKYGFVHKCRCAQDWADGNLNLVSVCFLGMVEDAMDTLEAANKEIKELKRDNAKLRISANA